MNALFTLAQGTPPPPPPQNGGFEQTLAEALDSLVSSGTITEDQETAIANILMFSSGENSTSQTNPFEDILDSLVSAGTITQDQETAIGSAFKSAVNAYEMQLYGLQNMSAYNL
jgi:competence protein ComGC